MALFAPATHRWSTRILLGVFLALTLLAFVGVSLAAAQDCAGAKGKKSSGCAVKSCAAKASCASATQATADEKKPCTKEECIAKCMAKGMTKEEAEACWAKHAEGKAGPCHADSLKQGAAAGCPVYGIQITSAGDKKSCTKEECVAKLMASGMSKEDAEKKAETCMASGKCTGTHEAGKGCCAFNKDKKSSK